MNKKGAIVQDETVDTGINFFVLIIVVGFIAIVLVGAFKLFSYAPTNLTVIPRVSEIAIVRYLPESYSLEYYTGIAWKKLDGKAQVGEYVLDRDSLLLEFRDKWYNGAREANILTFLANGREVHASANLIEGPTSRVGISGEIRSYVNSELSSSSGNLENYILTMSSEMYKKTTKGEMEPVEIGRLKGLNLRLLSFTLDPIDVKKDFYTKSSTDNKNIIDELNVLSNKGLALKKEEGRGLAPRINLNKELILDLYSKEKDLKFNTYKYIYQVKKINLNSQYEDYTSTEIFFDIYTIEKKDGSLKLDDEAYLLDKDIIGRISIIPSYKESYSLVMSDQFENDLKTKMIAWRDFVLETPMDLMGQEYCITKMDNALVVRLDEPTQEEVCTT